jgi:hypothetical protein
MPDGPTAASRFSVTSRISARATSASSRLRCSLGSSLGRFFFTRPIIAFPARFRRPIYNPVDSY